MIKRVIVVFCFCIFAVGTAWFIFTDGSLSIEAAKERILQQATDVVINKANPDDVAALALKAINLAQGEKGVELWRLKADWGNMRRSDDIMELEKPRFTYYMPPDNVEVRITSLKGDIDQSAQRIRFTDSVVMTHAGRTVLGDQVIYLGKTREMVFPQGARISSEDFAGEADRIVWHLNDKIIRATGNIDITFKDVDGDVPVPSSTPVSAKGRSQPRRSGIQG